MPRLAPKLIELNSLEQKKIQARHRTPQQVAKRAKIVLLASQGKKSSRYRKRIRH